MHGSSENRQNLQNSKKRSETSEDNETLVKAIQSGEDRMEELYTKNYGLIFWIAKRFSGLAELEDMIQEGYIGLYTAATLYDETKEAKFSTYATFWINRTIKRYIENNNAVYIPINKQNIAARYNLIVQAFFMDTGREPTERELSFLLDIPLEAIPDIKSAAECHTVSLSAPIDEDGGELLDTIPDRSDTLQDAEERIYREELKEAIQEEVEKLPPEQKEVLRQKYKHGKTYKEIDAEIGKNSYVLHNKALRELRRPKHSKKLRPFADNLYSKSLHKVGVRVFNMTWTSATEREALRLYRFENPHKDTIA